MANLQQMMISKLAASVGLSEDMSLPELVELVNNLLELQAVVTEQPATESAALAEFADLAQHVDAAMKGAGGKLYRVRATPKGKPAISALVLVEYPWPEHALQPAKAEVEQIS